MFVIRKRLYAHPVESVEVNVCIGSLCFLSEMSSNTISCTCSMISGVVALYGRPLRGSSSRLVRPRLNSAAHFLIVENEGEESP